MRLWNAHKRVFRKNPLSPLKRLELLSKPDGWRKVLDEDAVKFVDDMKANNLARTPERQEEIVKQLLHNTPRFFSRSKNVPLELRKQIFLPDFVITLIRTPQLPPKYASFWVPLWFNKLDFKNYLKNVYNVDVLHIRSYVQQSRVEREERPGSRTQGRLFRPPARKKMTVELVDPFVYPEEEQDLSPWESETFKQELKQSEEMSKDRSRAIQTPVKSDPKTRDSIAQQAQDFLKGRRRWKPSWQSIATETRVMKGSSRPPGIRGTV